MTEPLSSTMIAALAEVMEQASAAAMLPRQPHFGEHTALRLSRPTWALVHRVIRERLEAEDFFHRGDKSLNFPPRHQSSKA